MDEELQHLSRKIQSAAPGKAKAIVTRGTVANGFIQKKNEDLAKGQIPSTPRKEARAEAKAPKAAKARKAAEAAEVSLEVPLSIRRASPVRLLTLAWPAKSG